MAEPVNSYSGASPASHTASMNFSKLRPSITNFRKKLQRNSSASGNTHASSLNSGSGPNKLKQFIANGNGGNKSTGSSAGLRSGTSQGGPGHAKRKRSIGLGRIALAFVLVACAIGFGYASYALMKNAEDRLAKDRFDSIAERAEASAEWVLAQKKQATDALALMFGSANPDAEKWPFVHMDGYKDIAASLKLITKGSLSFCPIVRGYGGEEQQRFEEYYYDLYEAWGFHNGTGESSFGKGIFGFGYDVVNAKLWPDYRYPVLTNYSKHGINNPNNMMVPFVQSDFGEHNALMLDVMFEEHRARVAHGIVACSEERGLAMEMAAEANETESDVENEPPIECGSITDMLWQSTKAEDVVAGPAGIMFSPIYPRNDPETLTGFILHKQLWHDLLVHAFEPDVSGIRVVLHTSTGKEHSYDVDSGEVRYVGNRTHTCIKRDPEEVYWLKNGGGHIECDPEDEWVPFRDDEYLYSEECDEYRWMNLSITENLFMPGTVEYFMDIYATEKFVSSMAHGLGETNDDDGVPISIVACIATVLVMIFTSLLFVSYDYCVRQEFDSKEKLLEAKRRFVRFVSHEVRTPLNTVCMGLTLLQNDLETSLSSDTKSNNKRRAEENSNNDLLVLKRETVEEWMTLSGQVFQNADVAVGVLSDLLNYDKIQMGNLSLELSLINLWSALEKTIEEFQVSAKEKLVILELDLSPLLSLPSSLSDSIEHESAKTTANPPKPVRKASELPDKVQNCKVIGDKIRLIQVFRNLISNGLKFSKEHDHMTVRVSFDLLPERKQKQEKISLHKGPLADVTKIGSVSVEVIDEGAGMTPEQVDAVFEDGTQFDRNKLQAGGGSGLGLNIARGIVLEHGGTLTCSSQGLGKGSTFTLCTTLYSDNNPTPLATAHKVSKMKNNSSNGTVSKLSSTGEMAQFMDTDEENALESSEFSIPNFRVLVVDDSVTNRKLCQRLLERNGHTTEAACDGDEAVRMVKESLETGKFYDCILLDYEMPVMNGPNACQMMRKMGCSSYIAGVTGNVMSEDVDHFRNCGANWVLPKPFQLKVLEDQWVEDGVTPFSHPECSNQNMVRVESSPQLIEVGDCLAVTFDSKIKPSKLY